jgi:hypothetical protein
LPNPLHFRWIWHAARSERKVVSRLELPGIIDLRAQQNLGDAATAHQDGVQRPAVRRDGAQRLRKLQHGEARHGHAADDGQGQHKQAAHAAQHVGCFTAG